MSTPTQFHVGAVLRPDPDAFDLAVTDKNSFARSGLEPARDSPIIRAGLAVAAAFGLVEDELHARPTACTHFGK